MKIIPVYYKGVYLDCFVDDEDYEEIAQYRWHLCSGYPSRSIRKPKRVLIRMHRYIMNPNINEEVDHKDLNKMNNQKDNLRVCSSFQNSTNKKPRNGKKYKGIRYDKNRPKTPWYASIKANGVRRFLGRYRTEEEAAEAYNKAAISLFGDFAYVNKIDANESKTYSVPTLS